jgi:hypothetical protein
MLYIWQELKHDESPRRDVIGAFDGNAIVSYIKSESNGYPAMTRTQFGQFARQIRSSCSFALPFRSCHPVICSVMIPSGISNSQFFDILVGF